MKTNDKTRKAGWAGAALLAVMGWAAGRAEANAGVASQLSIKVTITATQSVSVLGTQSSTQTVTFDGTQAFFVAATTVVVTNDSKVVTERWKLSTTASSYDFGTGAPGWSIVTTSGSLAAEQVSVQAVFGSSNSALGACTALTNTTWNSATAATPLSTTAQQYTTAGALVAATELTASGGTPFPDSATNSGSMFGSNTPNGGVRAMCWRVMMPPSTSLSGSQVVPIVVTAF